MNIVAMFFTPAVFFSIIAVLFIVAVSVYLISSHQEEERKKFINVLEQESIAKRAIESKVKELETELAKLKEELSIKNQMYTGLKGQYDELEKSFEEMQHPTISNFKIEKEPQVKNDKSIADLMQDLSKIEESGV